MPIKFLHSMPAIDSGYHSSTNTIQVGFQGPHISYQMILCHEMGHHLDKTLFPRAKVAIEIFRQELKAWRIAKSIIKPKLWKEHEAMHCLIAYADAPDKFGNTITINWHKMKIIPWGDRRLKQ